MIGKDNELEFPEGRGGCQGSEVALRPQPYCAKRNWGQQRSPGVPPIFKEFLCLWDYDVFEPALSTGNPGILQQFFIKKSCHGKR